MALPLLAQARRRCGLFISLFLCGCASFLTYSHDGEVEVLVLDGQPENETRLVSIEKGEPIPAAKFGQRYIPSGWAVALAKRWADLPFVFDPNGPEYCSALGVDKDRMLHASPVVRYRDMKDAKERCPLLVWKDDKFMIGLGNGHSQSTLDSHGERPSSDDATLGSPVLVLEDGKPRIEMLRVAVHFSSAARLMGVNPKTGKEEPVPAQWLLFTWFNGGVHVFLWTPFAEEEEGKSNFIRVYKPAANDEWEELGTCWVDVEEVRRAVVIGYRPAVHCKPDDFWLKD